MSRLTKLLLVLFLVIILIGTSSLIYSVFFLTTGNNNKQRLASQRKTILPDQTTSFPTTTISNRILATPSDVEGFSAPYNSGNSLIEDSAIVSLAPVGDTNGYWALHINGKVDSYNAPNYGSVALNMPGDYAVGIAPDYQTHGYWVLDAFGNVYAFNAPDLGGVKIPLGGWGQYPQAVAIVSSMKTQGYYILRANGEVDAFGLPYFGSLKGQLYYGTTAPIIAVSIAIDYQTGGYWILTSNGLIYSFNAPAIQSSVKINNNSPVQEIVSFKSSGFYILDASGNVTAFNMPYFGSYTNMPVGATASSMAIDPITGGYWIALNYSPYDGYFNPLRNVSALVPQEIDQGVDYCGYGPIYPLGKAVILNVYSSGWPNDVFIAYQLTDGPLRGFDIYVAENVTPDVSVGQVVSPTTFLGFLNDQGNCLETGWASTSNPHGFTQAHFEYNGENSTAYGLNFSQLLETLGSKPGLPQDNGPPGPLAQNWPTF